MGQTMDHSKDSHLFGIEIRVKQDLSPLIAL